MDITLVAILKYFFFLSLQTADVATTNNNNDSEHPAISYTYTHMLNRIVSLLQQNNPELAEKRRNTIKPPQLMRVGTKRTLWINFQEICKMMRRSSEHVFQYMLAELGTEGSIDAQQRLVIKGKFIPKVSIQYVCVGIGLYSVLNNCYVNILLNTWPVKCVEVSIPLLRKIV